MTRIIIAVVVLALSSPAVADLPNFQDELLDRMVGDWVMRGEIAGGPVVHDLSIAWVLDHQYLQITEVAREKNERGGPAYEAIVTIGWDAPSGRYVCQWLDSTGGSGLVDGAWGYAEPSGDTLAFLFGMDDDVIFHTTFIFERDADVWRWTMDAERDGAFKPFARVTLKRRPDEAN